MTHRGKCRKEAVRSVARGEDPLLLPIRSITLKDLHGNARGVPCDGIVSAQRDRSPGDACEPVFHGPRRSGAPEHIRIPRPYHGPISAESYGLTEERTVRRITGDKYALLYPVRPIAMENIGSGNCAHKSATQTEC